MTQHSCLVCGTDIPEVSGLQVCSDCTEEATERLTSGGSLEDVVRYISKCDKPKLLDQVRDAVNRQYQVLNYLYVAKNLETLFVGDRVKIRNLTTARLNGHVGTIEEIREDSFLVRFPQPVSTGPKKYSSVLVPFSCVEKV